MAGNEQQEKHEGICFPQNGVPLVGCIGDKRVESRLKDSCIVGIDDAEEDIAGSDLGIVGFETLPRVHRLLRSQLVGSLIQ
jgi:hypothetical protein